MIISIETSSRSSSAKLGLFTCASWPLLAIGMSHPIRSVSWKLLRSEQGAPSRLARSSLASLWVEAYQLVLGFQSTARLLSLLQSMPYAMVKLKVAHCISAAIWCVRCEPGALPPSVHQGHTLRSPGLHSLSQSSQGQVPIAHTITHFFSTGSSPPLPLFLSTNFLFGHHLTRPVSRAPAALPPHTFLLHRQQRAHNKTG